MVTATGLKVLPFGGIELVVDGEPVDPAQTMAYQALMLTGVPNFVFTVGYTNASWTLKADLVAEYVCRLLDHLDRARLPAASCAVRDPSVGETPLHGLHARATCCARSTSCPAGRPRAVAAAAELPHATYARSAATLDDGVLRFTDRQP